MNKTLKKFLTALLSAILLLINTNFAFAAEIFYPQSAIKYPTLHNAVSSTVDLSQYFDLDEFNQYMVEQLKLVNGDSSTMANIDLSKFNIPKSDENTRALQELIWYNSPELFRISGMGINYSGSKITGIVFYSYFTKDEYIKMHAELEEAGEKILIGIKDNEKLSDIEKLLLIHDRIAETCQYDYDRLLDGTITQTSYNAYGVLVLRDAVCMGYTLAYDYLLGKIGMKSMYCSSDTLNHAWNIVYLNDIPYHVDITWDDPVWDMAGRVKHENFLRSTAGMIETEHDDGNGNIDYFSFPTDTTYDDYYWKNITTAIQLLDDEFYYINSTDKTLNHLTDVETGESTELKKLSYTWRPKATSYYPGSYSKLLCDGHHLYYNSPDTVFRYDPETMEETEVFKPDVASFGSYYWIYGMEYNDCKITCEIFNSPNFNRTVKASYTQTEDVHAPSEWITIKEATQTEVGEKQRKCLNCDIVLETEEIPKIYMTPVEETTIDEDEKLVFTEFNCCEKIDDVLNISEEVSYEITASVTLAEKDFLGTGTIISIYRGDEKIDEYSEFAIK